MEQQQWFADVSALADHTGADRQCTDAIPKTRNVSNGCVLVESVSRNMLLKPP